MKKALSIMALAFGGIAGPASITLALSYKDFSSSVSSQIGQAPSTVDMIIASVWLVLAVILVYIAYRISVAKQRRAVNEAHQRMMERKRQPPPPGGKKPARPVKPFKPGR